MSIFLKNFESEIDLTGLEQIFATFNSENKPRTIREVHCSGTIDASIRIYGGDRLLYSLYLL